MATWTVTEARSSLPEILERVSAGEVITLTRHGLAVAVVCRPDLHASKRVAPALAAAAELGAMIEAAREKPFRRVKMAPGRVEEMVSDIRRDRDQR